jgi:hypothetical protein
MLQAGDALLTRSRVLSAVSFGGQDVQQLYLAVRDWRGRIKGCLVQ